MSQVNGHISQIIGPVIDVYFDTKGQDPESVSVSYTHLTLPTILLV